MGKKYYKTSHIVGAAGSEIDAGRRLRATYTAAVLGTVAALECLLDLGVSTAAEPLVEGSAVKLVCTT